MGAGEIIGGIISGGASLLKTGYDIYTNERDFDYQKALQRDIFAREDNAVQRRMKDLEAAGLNPNLAAGSAAGAGAVVGRSNTPNLSGNSIGTALDAASHISQLRMMRKQNEIMNNQKRESEARAQLANNEALLDNINLNTMLGLKSYVTYDGKGYMHIQHSGINGSKHLTRQNSPLMSQLYWQYQNNKNSADLLQKDVDWYNAQQIEHMIGTAARSIGGLSSGIGSAYKSFNYAPPNYNTYNSNRNFYSNPYIKNNW